jgi:hypothetical protein
MACWCRLPGGSIDVVEQGSWGVALRLGHDPGKVLNWF